MAARPDLRAAKAAMEHAAADAEAARGAEDVAARESEGARVAVEAARQAVDRAHEEAAKRIRAPAAPYVAGPPADRSFIAEKRVKGAGSLFLSHFGLASAWKRCTIRIRSPAEFGRGGVYYGGEEHPHKHLAFSPRDGFASLIAVAVEKLGARGAHQLDLRPVSGEPSSPTLSLRFPTSDARAAALSQLEMHGIFTAASRTIAITARSRSAEVERQRGIEEAEAAEAAARARLRACLADAETATQHLDSARERRAAADSALATARAAFVGAGGSSGTAVGVDTGKRPAGMDTYNGGGGGVSGGAGANDAPVEVDNYASAAAAAARRAAEAEAAAARAAAEAEAARRAAAEEAARAVAELAVGTRVCARVALPAWDGPLAARAGATGVVTAVAVEGEGEGEGDSNGGITRTAPHARGARITVLGDESDGTWTYPAAALARTPPAPRVPGRRFAVGDRVLLASTGAAALVTSVRPAGYAGTLPYFVRGAADGVLGVVAESALLPARD